MGATVFYLLMLFKAKESEIKKCLLCLGNISGDFSANNRKKTGLNRYVYDFFVDYIECLILVILSISINIWWKNMI